LNSYRNAEWRTFRNEVIRIDGHACISCGRSDSDGAVLHVHHKQYLSGHKPWEYPHDLCETLCAGCHAVEHGKIPPMFGWECVGYEDLEDLCGKCEYCSTPIRHVFLIQHNSWRPIEVGEQCCDNLTCSKIATNHMESIQRQRERRKRFISSQRWCRDRLGVHRIRQKQIELEVLPEGPSFRLRINGIFGKKLFNSLVDAKAFAFDRLDSGAIDNYLKKR
jgi:hypothetical protein